MCICFESDGYYYFKFILAALLSVPAIILASISRISLSKSSQSTFRATSSIILGIFSLFLISILIFAELTDNRQKRNKLLLTDTKHTIESVCTALKLYKLDCSSYPPEKTGLSVLIKKSNSKCDSKQYLHESTDFIDAWGNSLVYSTSDDSMSVISAGPDGKLGTKDDITCN